LLQHPLERDDKEFGKGGFISPSRGYDSFIAHEKFARVGVPMVFGRRCGSLVGGSWCEL
jgi:hypothetical protein